MLTRPSEQVALPRDAFLAADHFWEIGQNQNHESAHHRGGRTDVPRTGADIDARSVADGFRPATPIEVGIDRFVDWYCGDLSV